MFTILRLLEKEIVEVKHKPNVSFLEPREIVESYMKGTSYENITQKMTTNNTSHPDKYRAHMEKLVHLGLAQISKLREGHLLRGNITN